MLPLRSGLSVSPPSADGGRLGDLRRAIARLQTPALAVEAPACPLGIGEIDTALGSGLVRGALHEIAAQGEAHAAAATGFAVGMAVQQAEQVVWIAEEMALAESGAPYGPGLDLHGLSPERLLTVACAKAGELLWAMEEALHCRAVGVVIGEIRSARIELAATRRLSLAAATHGAFAVLLRSAPATEASAAVTRWVVTASSSPRKRGPITTNPANERQDSGYGFRLSGAALGRNDNGLDPPRFELALVRNRRGPLGSWTVEWSMSDASFVLAHPEPVARSAADRPDRPRAA